MTDCVLCGKVAIEKADNGEDMCVGCNNINKEIMDGKNG